MGCNNISGFSPLSCDVYSWHSLHCTVRTVHTLVRRYVKFVLVTSMLGETFMEVFHSYHPSPSYYGVTKYVYRSV